MQEGQLSQIIRMCYNFIVVNFVTTFSSIDPRRRLETRPSALAGRPDSLQALLAGHRGRTSHR